jgi:D-ribose pyranose/furanose isomerase RbsD
LLSWSRESSWSRLQHPDELIVSDAGDGPIPATWTFPDLTIKLI